MAERISNLQGDSLCNLEYLLVNLGRNHATAERLIKLFLESHLVLIQRMQDALKSADIPVLKDALHDIRSSCVLFSGHRCVDLAREFEQAVHEGEGDWNSMADSLSQCMLCMAGELASYLEKDL
ncbi:MAG: Hpt [Proteobacteria bacterium]|nr:Hpt [Pseudomonadota bacterium]